MQDHAEAPVASDMSLRLLKEFALLKGKFAPTGVSRSITFVEPGNLYKFNIDDGANR